MALLIVLVGLVILVWLVTQLAAARTAATDAQQRELRWLPTALREAELLFAEPRAMRIDSPVRTVAKVDRAYKLPDASVTPVELKTRVRHRVYEGDVIELSVQRLVLEGNRIGPIGDIAFVVTQHPVSGDRRRHTVKLISRKETAELVARYERIRAGAEPGTRTDDLSKCRQCAFRQDCRPKSMLLV